mmetsp:Transcript_20849/g.47918  ORF Transcript_20849/g.47918 Transcript_20849/m.47918 type:complete len:229 (-) Transcript_20849:74-760(-)
MQDGVVALKFSAVVPLFFECLIGATKELIHHLQVANHFFVWNIGWWEILLTWKSDRHARPIQGRADFFLLGGDLFLLLRALFELVGLFNNVFMALACDVVHLMRVIVTGHNFLVQCLQLLSVIFHLLKDGWQNCIVDHGLYAMNVFNLIWVNPSVTFLVHEGIHLRQEKVNGPTRFHFSCMDAKGCQGPFHGFPPLQKAIGFNRAPFMLRIALPRCHNCAASEQNKYA